MNACVTLQQSIQRIRTKTAFIVLQRSIVLDYISHERLEHAEFFIKQSSSICSPAERYKLHKLYSFTWEPFLHYAIHEMLHVGNFVERFVFYIFVLSVEQRSEK